MKHLAQIALLVFAILLLPEQGNASFRERLGTDTLLIATKDKKNVEFKIGLYVSVLYGAECKKINGRLIKINQDSIFLQPLNHNSNITSIAITDISSIMKLHKKIRKGWIAILSVLILLTIFGLILLQLDNLLSLIALGIPAVSLFTFIPFLLSTFIADWISKKSVKKGWSFKRLI